MKKWTIGIGVFIILAAVGAGAYYYFVMKDKEAAGETPTSRTVQAAKGSIVKQISGTGAVAANSRETVTAGKSGTIAAVHVKKGDKVKAGQILVSFEAADDTDDQIDSIEKNITKLEDSITDYQESYKEATGTENEENTKKSLQKNIESANKEIADYEEQLQEIAEEQEKEEKVVAASIDGEITEMTIEVGDEVNSNTAIATIVDYTILEFVTSVDELDISSVKVGQSADLSLGALTDKTIKAAVTEIAMEGTSSNGSSSFEVKIRITEIEGVKAGMSGEAAITVASKENIVVVPVNAVVEMGSRSFVRIPSENGDGAASSGTTQQRMPAQTEGDSAAPGQGSIAAEGRVLAGGRAGSRMAEMLGGEIAVVTTGLSDENFVEIVSGLKEGDSVLVPIAQGTAGMGSNSGQTIIQQGMFPGGGMSFPGGMGGGTRSTTGGTR